VQSVEEDAPRHQVVCGLLASAFIRIENSSQTLIDSTVYYLGKIFQSQYWHCTKNAFKILMALCRTKWLDSDQRIALQVKLEEMFSLYEVQPGRNISTLYALHDNPKEFSRFRAQLIISYYLTHQPKSKDAFPSLLIVNDGMDVF